MIDILLLTVFIIAEQITTANHIHEPSLNTQIFSILELQVKDLIIVEQVEAGEVVSSEQKQMLGGQVRNGE